MRSRRHSAALLGASAVPAFVVVWTVDPFTPWFVLVPLMIALLVAAPDLVSVPTGPPLVALGVAVAAAGVASLFYATPHGSTYLHWGWITVSDGSFAVAVASMSRILAIALPAMSVVRSMSAHELLATLAVRRIVPTRFALATLIALRLIPVVASDLGETRLARRANGRSQSLLSIANTTLVVAIRRAIRMSDIAETRGFSSPHRRWSAYRPFDTVDTVLLVVAWSIGIGALVVTSSLGLWNSAIR